MSTTTLMIVVGCVVCLKTCAFVAYVVRRGRRQRAELAVAAEALAAAEAAVPARSEQPGWRLQWAEPGVLLVENASDAEAARDVELTATLTAGSGVAASLVQAVRFVGTGACFTARFAQVDPWLAAATFSYSLVWLTPAGERRRECRTAHAVVPVPSFEPA